METRTQNVFIRQVVIGFGILSLIFCIDRLVKYWTVTALATKSIIVIPNVFHLIYIPNPNLLYIFNLPVWGMTLIIGVVMIILIMSMRSAWQSRRVLEVIGISSMLFGAVSNIIDRWLYGSVVDMISVPFWSTFNIADIMIVVGSFIVVWATIEKKEQS